MADREVDRRTGGQAVRQTNRQIHAQTEGQSDRQTNGYTDKPMKQRRTPLKILTQKLLKFDGVTDQPTNNLK